MDREGLKIVPFMLLLLLHWKRYQMRLGGRLIAIGTMASLMSTVATVIEKNVQPCIFLQSGLDEDLFLSICEGDQNNSTLCGNGKAFLSATHHELPYGATLYFNLESSDWMSCISSERSEVQGTGGLEVLQVERTLIGKGAHRQLSSVVTIGLEYLGSRNVCHMVMVEKLPSGIFADIFELQGLVNRGEFQDARVYGDNNLELPTLYSHQSIVVLHTIINTSSALFKDSELRLHAKVLLPLHARYPPLSLESHVPVNISLPNMLFHCSEGIDTTAAADADDLKMGQKKDVWTLLSQREKPSVESIVLQWAVPAGNPLHANVVAVTTAFTAFIGVVGLLVVSRYSFRSDRK